jgi:RNA polymerase sigma-70 factor (ECF subfamily)
MQATARMAGDPFSQEFEALFEEHYVLIYRTAYGITGRVEDAEDVVQTIFLRLLQREQPPDFLKNPGGYLYRAGVNLSLTVVQKRRLRERTEASEELAVSLPARVSSEAEEAYRRLYCAIAQLSPKAASILILRYLHDYSDAEIAKLLGTSRGVIAVTLYRSRARLRTLLKDSLGEER